MDALALSAEAVSAMQRHAVEQLPRECCGALLGTGAVVTRTLPLENASATPQSAFALSAAEFLRAEAEASARGLTVLGYYHSHVDTPAVPSMRDASAAWAGWWTVIVPVLHGAAAAPRAFRFDEPTKTFSESPER